MRTTALAVIMLTLAAFLTACDSGSDAPITPVATPRPTSSTLVTETVYSGTAKSRGVVELSSDITAHADAALVAVERLEFDVALAGSADPLDLGSVGGTTITYIDGGTLIDDIAYSVTSVAGNGDSILGQAEVARVTIDLAAAGVQLAAGEMFTLEIRPPNGSFLVLQRQMPAVLTPVVVLT